jgi:hypothetical protein
VLLKRHRTRAQRITIVYGVLCFTLILVVLQLWLLTATMNAWLGGDAAVVWPSLGASLVCFLLNLGLLRSL